VPEVVESHGDGTIELKTLRTNAYMQARERCALDGIGCAVQQRGRALIGGPQFAGQELAFGPFQLQGEDQVTSALPAIVTQELRASIEILECRDISGRRLGALARDEVQLSDLLSFIR
jgi:hypothetical protein